MLEQLCWEMSRDERENVRERDCFTRMASSVSSPQKNMLLTATDVLTSDPS